MADFCMQCSLDTFHVDTGDLADLCKPGERVDVICEGCGPTLVDETGRCVSPDCVKKHGEEEAEDATG